MLKALNLECVRGDRSLFNGLNFHLKAGECLVIHGDNGSGKTSLLRVLVGLAAPAAGALYWHGRKIKPLDEEYRCQLIYAGHLSGLKEELNAEENLKFALTLANETSSASAIHTALHQVGLQGKENLPTRLLSQGQKRRVNLARLILQKRPLWVLDEPLTALDSKATQWVTETIDRHLCRGGIAAVTTHHEMKLKHATHHMRISI